MSQKNWYKMDNVAKIFLASCNDRDTRALRLTCEIDEPVDEDILKKAVMNAIEDRPQYRVIIKRGFFWHYMEETELLPKVCKEYRRPCPVLYDSRNQQVIPMEITYYNNRINLDMFHALADGTGAIEYFNLIIAYYYKIKYPKNFENLFANTGATAADLERDSYKQFYEPTKSKGIFPKVKNAYHITGRKHPYKQLQFFEVHMKVSDILPKAKELGVSLTSYIGTRLMFAIRYDMSSTKKNKPVSISMPVNLRQYYESETSRNFFNSVIVSHVFKDDDTIEEVAREFSSNLKAQLTKDEIKKRMNNYEKLENLMLVRMVPLFIKNPVIYIGTLNEAKKVTCVLSNLGRIHVPEELSQHVKSYTAYGTNSTLFFTVCSCKDELTLGITCAYTNTSVLKHFISDLSKEGIEIEVYATKIYDK